MEDSEDYYPRKEVEKVLKETGKQLEDKELHLSPGNHYIQVDSQQEPNAELHIRLASDGEIVLQLGIFNAEQNAVFCRWDKSFHDRGITCDETGEEIVGYTGHKDYFEYNVEGDTCKVLRDEDDIPTSSFTETINSFCEEVGIEPPESVAVQFNQMLGDIDP